MTVQKFPGYRWHPESGDCRIFDKAEDVPEGWLESHPGSLDQAAPAADKAYDALPLSKKEIVAALDEGGVSFKKNAPVAALYALLMENLKKALTEQEIAFPEDADAKALMDLFPKE
jgi:hypothetical protein